MRHEIREQIAVALEERLHVPPQRDPAVADAKRVADVPALRDALDRRELREDAPIDTLRRLEMDGALGGVHVLRQLDLAHRIGAERSQRRGQPIDDVAARRQQLARCARIADVVRPLAEEADAVPADVQPRAHPVALFRRCRHDDRRRQIDATDPPECIRNHVGLERELPRIRDVRIERAPADEIDERLAPIG